jgi:hypothetical protein
MIITKAVPALLPGPHRRAARPQITPGGRTLPGPWGLGAALLCWRVMGLCVQSSAGGGQLLAGDGAWCWGLASSAGPSSAMPQAANPTR